MKYLKNIITLLVFFGLLISINFPLIAQNNSGNTSSGNENGNTYQKGKVFFQITKERAKSIHQPDNKGFNYLNQFGFLSDIYNKYPGIHTINKAFHFKGASEALNRIYRMEFSENEDMQAIIADLEKLGSDIEYAEPIPVEELFYEPNDPFYLTTTYNYNWNWHLDIINAEAAWDITEGDSNIKAAVVDNAVWEDHPDLDLDPANLYNAVTENTGSAAPPASVGQTGETAYTWSHGTHCMGTVGATKDNGIGVASLASGVTIMGVRAADDNGDITHSANGVQWAVNNGADVVSLSLGSSEYNQSLETFYQDVHDYGVVVLAASGNDGVDAYSYPAAYGSVIAVGSCDADMVLSSFSNYGDWVDIAAPGGYTPDESSNVSQLSTTYCEAHAAGSVTEFEGEYYDIMQGTSMACPGAASLASLLLSCDDSLSPDEIKAAMMNSSQDLTGGNSINPDGGIIDAEAALMEIGCSSDTPPTAAFTASPTSTCSGDIQFTDQSSFAESWNWDFGDGNTSTAENPEHAYTSDGTYTVSLTVTNPYGSDTHTETDYIVVDMPEAPTVTDAENCGAGEMTLSASGNGTLNWYDAETGGSLVTTGTQYTNNFSTTTSYYVEDVVPGATHYTGKPDNTGDGGYFGNVSYIHGLIFDALTDFTIKSVKVYADGGKERVINLKDESGTIIETRTVDIPDGESRIDLNIDVPPGLNYTIECDGDADLYRNSSGTSYPYEVAGVVSIHYNTADDINYYYYFYDWEIQEGTCESPRTEVTATVHDLPSVDIGGDQTICETGEATFNAGTGFSSYNWSNSATTESITVSTADVYSVTVTDEYGCEGEDAAELFVDAMPDATINPVADLCEDEGAITLTAATGGGTWNGPGVTGDSFDPASAGPGDHTITYEVTNSACTATDDIIIHVDAIPDITIDPVDALCIDDSPVTLSATPTGGTWSGTGISGTEFDPGTAGIGTHTITYEVTEGACTASEITEITVSDYYDATIDPVGDLCENDAAITLTAADEGGTWSGTGITDPANGTFDPATAGPGDHTITYEISGSCGNSDTETIHVDAMPDATIDDPGAFCYSDPAQDLTAATPGGTWSGTGITDPANGTFDPGTAGNGTHTVTYEVNNGECTATDDIDIYVSDGYDATIDPVSDLCETDDPVTLTAADAGGTWSGTGVTGEQFDPATSGPGDFTVSYEISGSCGDYDEITIHVDEMPTITNIDNAGPFCESDDPVTLSATPQGGEWDGPGVEGNQFDPNSASVGEHLITYEMQNGSCSDSETIVITVGAAPDIDISVTDATSSESSDGSATASASGGLSPYEYYWSNGDTDATMENVPAGNYSVMVTDAAGCVSSAPVHIDFLNSMDEENSPGFIVYPNPAENKIFVKTKNMQAEKIELINTLGQSLLVRDVHSDVEFFDVTHIGSGIYFIRINTKDTAYIQKVVIGGR